MGVLYNYGISQEDVRSECRALDMTSDDSLLCIASAGEMPLNVAALHDVSIVAVDNSPNQLRLCRIKQLAAQRLDAIKAASFLGYMDGTPAERQDILRDEIGAWLPEEDRLFWQQHKEAIQQGVVSAARFEKYIRKVSALGRSIVGGRNLFRLFGCKTTGEQQAVFDSRISGILLKTIFNIAFHPKIYRNRGIDPAGLTHSGTRNIAEFFYGRFRDFCCSTMARENYYLQYTFFNRLLFPEALPEFLQPALHDAFVRNSHRITYRLATLESLLKEAKPGTFNKIHLSNIGDWMSRQDMASLFALIRDKTLPGSRIVMRYIHLNHEIPVSTPELFADHGLGEELVRTDRYPFYSIVPISRK